MTFVGTGFAARAEGYLLALAIGDNRIFVEARNGVHVNGFYESRLRLGFGGAAPSRYRPYKLVQAACRKTFCRGSGVGIAGFEGNRASETVRLGGSHRPFASGAVVLVERIAGKADTLETCGEVLCISLEIVVIYINSVGAYTRTFLDVPSESGVTKVILKIHSDVVVGGRLAVLNQRGKIIIVHAVHRPPTSGFLVIKLAVVGGGLSLKAHVVVAGAAVRLVLYLCLHGVYIHGLGVLEGTGLGLRGADIDRARCSPSNLVRTRTHCGDCGGFGARHGECARVGGDISPSA